MILNDMGVRADIDGDYGAAIASYEQALHCHRKVGNRNNEGGTLSNLAYATLVLGDYDAAFAQFEQARDLFAKIGSCKNEGLTLINMGIARLNQGRPDEARALFDALSMPHLAIEAKAGLVLTALLLGDLATALRHCNEVLSSRDSGVSLDGSEEPMRVHLICHQVLAAAADPRAPPLLSAACQSLQERAARISDPLQRQRYLSRVPHHRELLAAWRDSAPQPTSCW